MTAQTAPFALGDRVRPKADVSMPVQNDYTIDAVMLDKDGWKVLLAGLHIGYHGWWPAKDFEKVKRLADQFPITPGFEDADFGQPDSRFAHG